MERTGKRLKDIHKYVDNQYELTDIQGGGGRGIERERERGWRHIEAYCNEWILVISMLVHVMVQQCIHGLHSASWQHTSACMSMHPPLTNTHKQAHMDLMRQ